jgi:hypothetical protein
MPSAMTTARGFVNVLFGAYFAFVAADTTAQLFARAGAYLFADGALALGAAYLLARATAPAWLKPAVFANAATRAALGAWLLFVPALTQRVITEVFVVVVVFALAVGLGAAEIAIALRHAPQGTPRRLAVLAPALMVLIGVATMLAYPNAAAMRFALALYALAYGAVLLAAARLTPFPEATAGASPPRRPPRPEPGPRRPPAAPSDTRT